MARSLYEKYGGFASISRIVMTFYERALESERIGDYFEAIDMARLVDHQTKFIASLLGGPAAYTDDRLRAVHAHLALDDADLDEMKALLAETLAEHGFEPRDVQHVMDEIEARRPAIVARRGA